MWKPFSYSQIDPKLMQELTARQNELAEKLILQPLGFTPKIIAGIDSSLIDEDKIFSVIVVFRYPSLDILEVKQEVGPLEFPYIPGFLAFREIPTIIKVFEKLENKPELLVVDGNGIIHKRKMGIASHLGVLLNIPSLGIAKKLLVGNFSMPADEIKSSSPIMYKDEQLGYALRSKSNVKPVFVSPGHLINLEDSLSFVISVLGKYRLPEPTRIADDLSKKLKPKILKEPEAQMPLAL